MHVAPAVIAAAERHGSSGHALLQAFLAGYEVAARLFRSVRTRPAVHPHGHIGGIGAAVGVALLADVDPVHAARVAGTTPIAATWQACYDGATARNAYTGHSASTGIRAADMARAGFRGSSNALALVLEEFFGAPGETSLSVDATLDHARLAIEDNYFKVHSACALTHTGLEAALGLVDDGLDAADVDRVLVETVEVGLKVNVGTAIDELSGRFSMPYAVATALVTGRTDADAFEFKSEVADLARRVEVRVDPQLECQWPAKASTRVTVTTSAGTASHLVENAKGHPSRPLSVAEHRAKFVALIGDDVTAASWWDRFASLSDLDDCRHLLMEG
jgi:2-methylcitrate dehydratase PrpD